LRIQPSPTRPYGFLEICGAIATFFLFAVQCTWTPEVKTPIHQSEKGNVTLQTSGDFKIAPQHPQVLSESLIKQILQGISQIQERGILQELFISDPKLSPVFSPSQIEFLTPHLAEAFSKATSEELITFRSLGNDEEGVTQVTGTVAVFSPTIFFLMLQSPGHSSKMGSSSRNLQKHTTLMFSQNDAMLQPKDVHRFMKISGKNVGIAIDYAVLNQKTGSQDTVIERRPGPSITTSQPEKTSPEMNTLQEQLQDLQKQVEEQAEEIQRLQQTGPQ
jgi:hypothetical protein